MGRSPRPHRPYPRWRAAPALPRGREGRWARGPLSGGPAPARSGRPMGAAAAAPLPGRSPLRAERGAAAAVRGPGRLGAGAPCSAGAAGRRGAGGAAAASGARGLGRRRASPALSERPAARYLPPSFLKRSGEKGTGSAVFISVGPRSAPQPPARGRTQGTAGRSLAPRRAGRWMPAPPRCREPGGGGWAFGGVRVCLTPSWLLGLVPC